MVQVMRLLLRQDATDEGARAGACGATVARAGPQVLLL
jgi:hypothetical protein